MTPEQLTEMRQYYLSLPVIMPMLERFRRDALNRLMMQHQEGNNKYDTIVAELAVIQRMEIEFKQKEAMHNTLQERENARK
jgi:hypothetical protein